MRATVATAAQRERQHGEVGVEHVARHERRLTQRDSGRQERARAFEMFRILGQPYFCFHDADVRPEGESFAENLKNLEIITERFAEKMEVTGTKLLWGTANLFSHRRFMAGAATNPDPDVFAWSAATIKRG